jgi:cbb3-type cytochrome oxidase subunit 3
VSRRSRRTGCIAFGVFWILLFLLTCLFFALGDCERDPDTGDCMHQPVQLERMVFGGELLLLVAVGWIFYRREMKDDEF